MENLKTIRQKILLSLLLNLNLFFTSIKTVIIEDQKDLVYLKYSIFTGENTLVVFDIDETIMTYRDKILNAYYQRSFAGIQYLDEEMFSKIYLAVKEELVNQNTPQVIQSLQNRGVKTIALTSRSAGTFGRIASKEDFCYQRLRTKEIDFSRSFPRYHNTFLPLLVQRPPLLHNGIIFANGESGNPNSKGMTLVSFLNLISLKKWYQFKNRWLPRKIIFVDNERGHLETVEQALGHYYPDIEFVGLHHTLEARLREERPFCYYDFDVAQFQINHFTKPGQWLHDDQIVITSPDNVIVEMKEPS